MEEPETMLEWAKYYAQIGFRVFPLKPRSKRPDTPHGMKDATRDMAQIVNWWTECPSRNIGIATGGGIVVIDIDVDEDSGIEGYDYLREWESSHGDLPETVTSITGRGGMHIFYRANLELKNTVNEDYKIDIRGDGGYIVAPPSVHRNGREYAWENHPFDYSIADADENALSFIASLYSGGSISTRGSSDQVGCGSSAHGLHGYQLPDIIVEGGRNLAIHRYACQLQQFGVEDYELCKMVNEANAERCVPPLGRDEIEKILTSALGYQKGDSIGTLAESMRARTERKMAEQSRAADNAESFVLANLTWGKNGPDATVDNARRVLDQDSRLKGRFWYDDGAYIRMVTLPLPWDGGEGDRRLLDADYIEALMFAEREYGYKGKDNMVEAIKAVCFANRRDPLREWLESLEWDGEDRISELLPRYLGCEKNEYTVEVMRSLMHGAVMRVLDPGCKYDYAPVLYGRQGTFKSTFVYRLALDKSRYLDNLPTFDGKAAAEMIRGKWIVELAEMAASKKTKDVETMKAYISMRQDTLRVPWGRETEDRPRRCVFIGTTNDHSFLTDSTGNRRFLPVEVGVKKPKADVTSRECKPYFEQAWAQAYRECVEGKPHLVLPKAIEDYAYAKQEQFTEEDPRVGIIEHYLESVDEDPMRKNKRVCTSEVCASALDLRREEYFQKKSITNAVMSIMMGAKGWQRLPKKQKTNDYGVQVSFAPARLFNSDGIEKDR